ncbi:ankyrin [Armillaria solidipes]|uniref:Ankyrin n=1 Tax=Armillaria solidipes TaxID=1076256 RepID=A0A2H3BN17_9AGAR|nr:ankyrin [Armillaria solidipes]
MYETCTESEKPPGFDRLLTLFDDPEKNLLAQRSCRQVSHFFTELKSAMKDGSSQLEWQPYEGTITHQLLLFQSEYKTWKDAGGFVYPCDCAGPSWLVIDQQLLWNHPWKDLSNTTSAEELDYMVYPLVLQGPASLVQDLLHKLPKFKERQLFYFGTPLMISIFAGKLDTVKMLLQDLHVNVNTCAWHYDCNYEVVSPIFLATKYGHVEAVKLLLQHSSATVFSPEPCPQWSTEQGQEPQDGLSDIIIGAANYGHADILQILIHHGVDMNTRSSISDYTVLHAAIRYGHIDSIKVLVDAGCDISPHSRGKTPLDLALNQQSSDLVQYLLDNGASFDQCLPQNFKYLKWAVGEPWYPEMQQYLVTPRGGGLKSQQDIEEIVHVLKKQLSSPPLHIIRAILDFAELWIVTSTERCEFTGYDLHSPCGPYISTPLTACGPENPVRRIVFTMLSGELGQRHKGHSKGLYSGSSTWFEAGVDSSPGVFMHIQDNVYNDFQHWNHVNVWDYQDAPSPIKEWMSKIKLRDKISVYPRVGTSLAVNLVESVTITVYTSCV